MHQHIYLDYFKQAAARIDKKQLAQKELEVAAGTYKSSAFIKVYKRSWATPLKDPLTAESRIFFSVWTTDPALEYHKMYYNIHAFKLRKLKNYAIKSREFAKAFRERFEAFEHDWPNVSVQFGPLTLMQGSLNIDVHCMRDDIVQLAGRFLKIEHLIDETLALFVR